jgi:hypothetical protein
MRIALAAACVAFAAMAALAGTPPASADSKHSTGRTVSPEDKGQMQPQGPTGPTDTTKSGAPPESPQGQTPPGMQAAPGGSSKTVVDPDSKKAGTAESNDKNQQASSTPAATPTDAFSNGVLTAPGALQDSETAPAKSTKRTDAADQLPIAAYALQHLSGEQRARIHGALHKAMAMAGHVPALQATIGAEVPTTAVLSGLEPVPDAVVAQVPELKGLVFLRAGEKILIASPTMHRVLAVLE